MTGDLRGLVRHVSRVFGIGATLTAVVAFFVWLYDRGNDPAELTGVVIVLGTAVALQALWWFGLVLWADTADDEQTS